MSIAKPLHIRRIRVFDGQSVLKLVQMLCLVRSVAERFWQDLDERTSPHFSLGYF